MAITTRILRCAACGNEFSGSWDQASSIQPDSATCPKCRNKEFVRPKDWGQTDVETIAKASNATIVGAAIPLPADDYQTLLIALGYSLASAKMGKDHEAYGIFLSLWNKLRSH